MSDASGSRQRWDTDERLLGVAHARVFAPAGEDPAALARRPGWVAEEPGAHLEPHLTGAHVPGLDVRGCRCDEDGLLEVDVDCPPGTSRREIRRRAWALLGTIAEPAAHVREHDDGD